METPIISLYVITNKLYVQAHDGGLKVFFVPKEQGLHEARDVTSIEKISVAKEKSVIVKGNSVNIIADLYNYLIASHYHVREATMDEYQFLMKIAPVYTDLFPEIFNSSLKPDHYAYY